MEAVLTLATMLPTTQTENFNVPTNDEALAREEELTDDTREEANLKLVTYVQEVARVYNKNVCIRPFNVDVDGLVLRTVVKKSNKAKFMPKWEGFFLFVKKVRHGS